MVRALFIDMLEGRVGSEVYDPYRRRIGVLVSFDSELDGRVTKVSILVHGTGEIHDYLPESIEIEGDRIIVKPEWKTLADKTRDSYRRAIERYKRLEELYHQKEVPEHIYREFATKLDKELRRLREQLTKVREMIKRRKSELEIEHEMLIRSKTALRISYMSGEIRSDAFRAAMEKIKSMEESIKLEMKDLEETLKKLEEVESLRNVAASEKKVEEPTPTTSTQPIPVKIIE